MRAPLDQPSASLSKQVGSPGGAAARLLCRAWIAALLVSPAAFAGPGRLDTSFVPTPPPNGPVRAILPLVDGSVIVAGEFTSLGSSPQAYLAKYREDGTVDPSFDPVLDGPVQAITATTLGQIFIGGSFTSVDGTASRALAAITSAGNLAASQFPVGAGFNGTVRTIKQTGLSTPFLAVGGSFTTYKGASARNFAGLSSTGSLERNYDVNGPVNAIDRYGSYLVFGGSFTTAGGYSATNIGIANSFGISGEQFLFPHPNGAVTDILSFSKTIRNGNTFSTINVIVFGGAFSNIGSAPGIAAFSPDHLPLSATGLSKASCFAVDSDRLLLTGHDSGDLRRFGPVPGNPSTWSADAAYLPSGHADGKIEAIAQETKFRYYIGGEFMNVDSQPVPYFARLLGPLGENPPAPPTIQGITAADDRVIALWSTVDYATGYDLLISRDGGSTWEQAAEVTTLSAVGKGLRLGESYLLRVRSKNTNGAGASGPAQAFTTSPRPSAGSPAYTSLPGNWANGASNVDDLFTDSSGRLVILGPNDMQGQLFGRFAVLDQNLRPVIRYNTTNNPSIDHAAACPGGGYIVRPNLGSLKRLTSTGQVDSSFVPAYDPTYHLREMDVQSDGRLILAGDMRKDDGAPNDSLVRLNPDGSIDAGFDPLILPKFGTGATIHRIKVLPDDRLLIIGDFVSIDGIPMFELAILDSNGELDPNFRPPPGTTEFWDFDDADVDNLGRVLACGRFDNEGSYRTGVIRLLSDGSADPSWDQPVFLQEPSTNLAPDLILVQDDGKAVVAGAFNSVNGVRACSMARLNTDGTLDSTFDCGLGLRAANGALDSPDAMTLMPDSSIAVGGRFATIDGEQREGFVVLRGDSTPNNYKLWLAASTLPAGSSMDDDGDGDGFGLGLEFAYQMNPSASDRGTLFSLQGQQLQIKPPTQRGVKLSGLFSNDLDSWQTVPIRTDWTIVPPLNADPARGFFQIQVDPE